MSVFLTTLTAVCVLLLTAAPGYVLMKRRMIAEACIPGASKILLYVCQPCLAVYTFKSTAFSVQTLTRIGIFALVALLLHAVMLSGAYLLLRKRCEQPVYRIITLATSFANCAFFGIPIIEALFPDAAPDLIVYTTVYALVMNIIGWTVGAAIIARSTSYIRVKGLFLNPATVGAAVALLLFCLEIPIQADLYGMLTLLGRMCTPLSMLIMGMRLATVPIKRMFTDVRVYLASLVKLCVMPLVAFALAAVLPIDPYSKRVFYIIACCPTASVVLNFSEIIGEGQGEAANLVLLGTILSALTLPLMMLLLPLI